jgi:hypothetical protein
MRGWATADKTMAAGKPRTARSHHSTSHDRSADQQGDQREAISDAIQAPVTRWDDQDCNAALRRLASLARVYERPLHVPAYLPDFFILRLMPLGFRLGDTDFLRKRGYSLGGCYDCCGKRRAPGSFELPHAKAGNAKQER